MTESPEVPQTEVAVEQPATTTSTVEVDATPETEAVAPAETGVEVTEKEQPAG